MSTESHPASSSARILAPIALAVCAVAVLVVIASAGTGADSPTAPAAQESSSPSPARDGSDTATERTEPERSTYTVKTGDTLGGIAVETGVPVETLQELNPALDPQALATGQKIKLVQ